jgi:osmotically-inducible protein OsmY
MRRDGRAHNRSGRIPLGPAGTPRHGIPIRRSSRRCAPSQCTGRWAPDRATDVLNQENTHGQGPEAEEPRGEEAKAAEDEARRSRLTVRGGSGAGCTRVSEKGIAIRASTGTSAMGKDKIGSTDAVPRLEVRLSVAAASSDEAIAERMLQALFSAVPLRRERIRVRIAQARVTLTGTVATEVERVAVERLITGVEGVVAVANSVTVGCDGPIPEVTRGVAEAYGGDEESGDVAGRIEALFVREAGLGATEVLITAVGGKVVLSGHVHSWRERDLAERIAWAAPGVTEVMDRITVR